MFINLIIYNVLALHEYFEKNNIDGLSDHDRNRCSQCLCSSHPSKERLTQQHSSNELFSKIG